MVSRPLARLAETTRRLAAGARDLCRQRPHRPGAGIAGTDRGQEHARIVQRQAFDDFGAGAFVGGGGQRHTRHFGPAFMQHAKLAVFGTEIVTPLRHAMRFVDREQRQLPLLVEALQQFQKAGRGQALRRHVQHGEPAREQILFHLARLFKVEGGVEVGGSNTGFLQRADLVVHQRHQWRHDDAATQTLALPHDGRNLVAERLAAAGRHQHQRIVALADAFDDGLLLAAKGRVAEDLLEHLQGGGGLGRVRHRRVKMNTCALYLSPLVPMKKPPVLADLAV